MYAELTLEEQMISILLMCLSGHVLTSPAVSIFVAVILITMIDKNNQNRKEIK